MKQCVKHMLNKQKGYLPAMSQTQHTSSTSFFKGQEILFYTTVCLRQVTWLFQLKSVSILSPLYLSVCAYRHPGGLRAFCQIDTTPAFCLYDAWWMLSSTAGAFFFQDEMMSFIDSIFFSLFLWQWTAQSPYAFFCLENKLKKFDLCAACEGLNILSLRAVNDAFCASYHSRQVTGYSSLNRIVK